MFTFINQKTGEISNPIKLDTMIAKGTVGYYINWDNGSTVHLDEMFNLTFNQAF